MKATKAKSNIQYLFCLTLCVAVLLSCAVISYTEEVKQAAQALIAKDDQDAPVKDKTAKTPRLRDPFLDTAFAFEQLAKSKATAKKKEKQEAIILSGDKIEYATDSRNVTITGNAEVIYQGQKLTCNKLTIDTGTKSGLAEGHARLDQETGIIMGETIDYDFASKKGVIMDAGFRSNPYYGRAKKMIKVSDDHFLAKRCYMTTCDLDHPHYRFGMRSMDFYPGNKMIAKGTTFYIGPVPILYLPKYEHQFRNPLMNVQVMPGSSKDWGPYLLTDWYFNLSDDISADIFLDYRSKLGIAQGFGTHYKSDLIGKGDFKFYYTHESTTELDGKDKPAAEFQRYLIRWRHKWDIEPSTNLIAEYYRIVDSKMATRGSHYQFLKDYFFREYEEDEQPPTFTSFHKSFRYTSLDFVVQKRINRWYNPGYLEKLPEIKFTVPNLQFGETRFYFDSSSSFANYNRKNQSTMTPAANDTNPNVHMNRIDTYNKFSAPLKVSFVEFSPFVANQETIYSRDINGKTIPPRTIFSSGASMSTKFYRLFNVKTNFMGLDLNDVRHVITPTVNYSFNHEPTILSSRLRQIDGIDSLTRNNSFALELSNKLQTKRGGSKIDFFDFRLNTAYLLKPKTGAKRGSNFSDMILNLTFYPTTWLALRSDATYNRSVATTDENYNKFTNVNYDMGFTFGKDRSFGIGQRYQRKAGNQITSQLNWRISPKWKFSIYERYEMGSTPSLKKGIKEQEYVISRDMHCWEADFTYNIKPDTGHSFMLIFRLKAFPELQFNYNQSYNAPKAGSQKNQ